MLNDDHSVVAPKSGGLKAVFVGRRGLRSGWRVLLFLPVFIAASIPLSLAFGRNFGTNLSPLWELAGEVPGFAILLGGTLLFAHFERRRLADYGLPTRQLLGRQFWTGALWGFVMISFVVALMAVSGAYTPGGFALGPLTTLKYGLLWGIGFLFVGLFEEFSFRGYAQFTLTWGIGFWPAAAVTCILFALAHAGNPGESWVGVLEVVLIAFFLCLALRRTGSLWFAIGWHMAFDWGESFFYSTADSGMRAAGHMLNASMHGSKWLTGGTVGPEATVFDVIVTALGILLLAKVYPVAKYPALPAPAGPLETTATSDPMNLPA